jgi:hypothetical protein
MFVFPAETAVTRPLEFTVATPIELDVQLAAVPVPVSWEVVPIHKDALPVTVGFALTVIACVTKHPLLLVYVIVVLPAATPVTTPELDTVAVDGIDETHGFEVAAVALPVNAMVAPTHTALFPVIVGLEFTVINALTAQPRLLVYVIVEVPTETAVTSPVNEMVATEVLPDTHGLVVAAVPDPVSCEVKPTHIEVVPDIVGLALTVTVVVALQPRLLV